MLIVILSAGTLLWLWSENPYISLLSIPPVSYIVIITFPEQTPSFGVIIIAVALQAVIIGQIKKSKNKNSYNES